MKLIEFDNYEIRVADEALLIKPIRKLFNQDKTSTKEKFFQQMSYMYFMINPASTYMYIIDSEERAKEIIKQEGLPEDFKPSKELQEAMDIYAKHCETSSTKLLKSTRVAVDKLRQFLENVDLFATDDKGKPLYQVNSITSAIKQIPELAKSLIEAEKTVAKEIDEISRVRGGNNKKAFEDGISFN